jgi:hypothetical protein
MVSWWQWYFVPVFLHEKYSSPSNFLKMNAFLFTPSVL